LLAYLSVFIDHFAYSLEHQTFLSFQSMKKNLYDADELTHIIKRVICCLVLIQSIKTLFAFL
jgi:hypothetical protein